MGDRYFVSIDIIDNLIYSPMASCGIKNSKNDTDYKYINKNIMSRECKTLMKKRRMKDE